MRNGLLTGDRPLVLGHRGCSQRAPENTMASFGMCVEDGIDGVELDVHLCRTGELVVAHDSSLKRTAGVDRVIEETDFGELRTYDIGSFKDPKFSDQRIPLLGEVFDAFSSRFVYDIELKSDIKTIKANYPLAELTWKTIKDHHLEERVMVSSFNPMALRAFGLVCGKSVPTADIFCDAPSIPRILRHGAGRLVSLSSYLKPMFDQVDEAWIRKYTRRLGYPVITWTVNDPAEARRLTELGVNGLIGNDPMMLRDCVRAGKGDRQGLAPENQRSGK